jgi:hypothetical protein
MTKQMILVLAVVAGVGGCATAPPVWTKPKAQYSHEGFLKDKYDCLRSGPVTTTNVTVPLNGMAVAVPIENYPLFNSCMEAKGWTLRPASAR